jgi:hypothetical protein
MNGYYPPESYYPPAKRLRPNPPERTADGDSAQEQQAHLRKQTPQAHAITPAEAAVLSLPIPTLKAILLLAANTHPDVAAQLYSAHNELIAVESIPQHHTYSHTHNDLQHHLPTINLQPDSNTYLPRSRQALLQRISDLADSIHSLLSSYRGILYHDSNNTLALEGMTPDIQREITEFFQSIAENLTLAKHPSIEIFHADSNGSTPVRGEQFEEDKRLLGCLMDIGMSILDTARGDAHGILIRCIAEQMKGVNLDILMLEMVGNMSAQQRKSLLTPEFEDMLHNLVKKSERYGVWRGVGVASGLLKNADGDALDSAGNGANVEPPSSPGAGGGGVGLADADGGAYCIN